MSNANRAVELPLAKTVYQAYTFQGGPSAMIHDNPSIRNWYLNEVFILCCTRNFVKGSYSSPEVLIEKTRQYDCPYLECEIVSAEYLGETIHSVIRAMIDAGYYIFIYNLDDYYVKGKSWYHKWHFAHDGVIFGYDQKNRTYNMLSYDEDWIFRPYKTSQSGVEKGFLSCADSGRYGILSAMKPKAGIIELNPRTVLKTMKEYLDSSMEKYPPESGGTAFGIVVHEYLAMYLDCLFNEMYPHERMDRRVFRMIWEHKVIMLERLIAVEDKLGLDHEISTKYAPIVHMAETLRMMYASHFVKPRKSLLPVIKKKLLEMKDQEAKLLNQFVEKLEEILKSAGGDA